MTTMTFATIRGITPQFTVPDGVATAEHTRDVEAPLRHCG